MANYSPARRAGARCGRAAGPALGASAGQGLPSPDWAEAADDPQRGGRGREADATEKKRDRNRVPTVAVPDVQGWTARGTPMGTTEGSLALFPPAPLTEGKIQEKQKKSRG